MGHQLGCWAAPMHMAQYYGLKFLNLPIWINGPHGEKDDYIEKKYLESLDIVYHRYVGTSFWV